MGIPGLTAVQAVILAERLSGDLRGQTVLVTGASSAVGHYITQMVTQLGARVMGTVGSEAKAAHAQAAGLQEAIFYKTVISDLSDLANVYYDVLAFFSPTGIKSLFVNFPDFEQNNTRIAVFGSTTQKEALEHGLRIDIMAPSPETPSMTMALEKYIAKANKEVKESKEK